MGRKFRLKTRRDICEYVYRTYFDNFRTEQPAMVSTTQEWRNELEDFLQMYNEPAPFALGINQKMANKVRFLLNNGVLDRNTVSLVPVREKPGTYIIFVIDHEHNYPLTEIGKELLHKGSLYFFIKYDWRSGLIKSTLTLLFEGLSALFLIILASRISGILEVIKSWN